MWKMPDWMKPYSNLISIHGEDYIAQMVNNNSSIQSNIPKAIISSDIIGRVVLISKLKKSKLLKIVSIDNQYDDQMDSEVINLCNALNRLPGIKTFESCSGHGKQPLSIFFTSIDPEGLFFLTRCVDKKYWKYGNHWTITLTIGDVIENNILPTLYLLESKKIGEEAYLQSNDLINNMINHLNDKDFLNLFKINLNKFNL